MSAGSKFSAALASWQEINLAELQKKLDIQGVEIVDNQKEGLLGRKTLADKTREFKKLPDDEKLNAFRGLLKAYQTEIDSITKRCKSSDNAFLNVYKVLAEAPDPYPLLEAAVDQAVKVAEAVEHEGELKRLREENADMKKRLSETSTLESSKKKLELKVEQLESKMDDLIQDKVAQKTNELNATYDERIRNYKEREQDLQKQVSLAKAQLRDLRASNEHNQAKLFDQSQRQDQEIFSKLAEVDMVIADLDQANTRIATVERRNEILRAEIETLRSGNETSVKVKDMENQITELEAESERLSRALENQKSVITEIEQNGIRKVREVTDELHRKGSEVETLKQRLARLSDYDEIKRELEIIKFVEFSGLDDDGDEQELYLPGPNATKTHHNKSLEALLASKNKRIQEELTKFRILHSELQVSLKNVESRLDSTSAELQKQKELNEKLENDLFAINNHDENASGSANKPSEDDILAGLDLGKKSTDTSARSTPIPFAPSADTSILPIVTSQRDRFRQRNAELEEELRKQYQTISELRAEVKSLQADNLKLYEKVRYMQSYREDSAGMRSVSQLDPLPSSSRKSDNLEDGIGKYHSRYEESVNPFEAFRGREQTRGYQSLNPLERTVLLLTRPLAGSRRARTLFVLYAIALHGLLLYSTYTCSASSQSHLQKQMNPYAS